MSITVKWNVEEEEKFRGSMCHVENKELVPSVELSSKTKINANYFSLEANDQISI